MPQCTICAKIFTRNKNLYQHMRNKHNIAPQVPGKICCPITCSEKFRTYHELRSHLESFHQQSLEKEEYDFPNFNAFEIWKKHYEEISGYGYVRRITGKHLSKGEVKTYFICHRSGVYRSESIGLRKPRKKGSNKIGTTCPSTMEASRSLTDGKVKVTLWKTHFGHEADFERVVSQKKVRSKETEKLAFSVCVVLPAAGIGERMGLDTPKQFTPIHQKPIISYTVEAFLRIDFVQRVVVVSSSENLQLMLKMLTETCSVTGDKLLVTEGSGFRHQSIECGLKALKNCNIEPDVVVIHDGVRPLVNEELITKVVKAAKEHGAAGVMCPLVSTVIAVDEKGFLDSALDRGKFNASEMPQAFHFNTLFDAYAKCTQQDFEFGTECLHLVQKYCNVKAKLIQGDSNCWKVTHRKDIYAASGALKENQAVGIINGGEHSKFLPFLRASLSKRFLEVHESKKLKDLTSSSTFPNLIKIYKDNNLYDVLVQQSNLLDELKMTQFLTIVHIIFNGVDSNFDFLDAQRHAKVLSSVHRNVVNYYIVLGNDGNTEDVFQSTADTASSLLFDNNPNLNGNIFLL